VTAFPNPLSAAARSGRREGGLDRHAVICLSYTWNDDAMKWLSLPLEERVRLMLHSLRHLGGRGAHANPDPIDLWAALRPHELP
jgi:monoamine oxidase